MTFKFPDMDKFKLSKKLAITSAVIKSRRE